MVIAPKLGSSKIWTWWAYNNLGAAVFFMLLVSDASVETGRFNIGFMECLIPFKLKLQNSHNTRNRSVKYFARVYRWTSCESLCFSRRKYFVSHRIMKNDTYRAQCRSLLLEERLELRVWATKRRPSVINSAVILSCSLRTLRLLWKNTNVIPDMWHFSSKGPDKYKQTHYQKQTSKKINE